MAVYIHHSKKGPDFTWDQAKIAFQLAEVRYRQGRLLGRIEGMGADLRKEASWLVHSLDVEVFGGIEGGKFVGMLRDATENHAAPFTRERLSRWHTVLYPATGKKISTSRAGVHFQSAAGEGSESKLTKLIHWANAATDIDPVVKAAVAQLWLVVACPFDKGEERLGELVMEGLLARANRGPGRFYSVSGQIQAERGEYEAIMARMRHAPDATAWIEWFLGCMGRALDSAGEALGLILRKDRFWERCSGMVLNDRQRMILGRLLDGQEEKLTSSKWASLTRTSQDTAGRDINDLVGRGLLIRQPGGGRSTSYELGS
jgi:Fic family protein